MKDEELHKKLRDCLPESMSKRLVLKHSLKEMWKALKEQYESTSAISELMGGVLGHSAVREGDYVSYRNLLEEIAGALTTARELDIWEEIASPGNICQMITLFPEREGQEVALRKRWL